MKVIIQKESGEDILIIPLKRHQVRKIKDFLINEYVTKNPRTHKLLFAGLEWDIPEEKKLQMYRGIVEHYSILYESYKKEQEILTELVVPKKRAPSNRSFQGVRHE